MSLFLHLKYANHKTKAIHTLAVIRNSVIIIVPVLLKTNDLQAMETEARRGGNVSLFQESFPRSG